MKLKIYSIITIIILIVFIYMTRLIYPYISTGYAYYMMEIKGAPIMMEIIYWVSMILLLIFTSITFYKWDKQNRNKN